MVFSFFVFAARCRYCYKNNVLSKHSKEGIVPRWQINVVPLVPFCVESLRHDRREVLLSTHCFWYFCVMFFYFRNAYIWNIPTQQETFLIFWCCVLSKSQVDVFRWHTKLAFKRAFYWIAVMCLIQCDLWLTTWSSGVVSTIDKVFSSSCPYIPF